MSDNSVQILHSQKQVPVSYTHLDVYKRQRQFFQDMLQGSKNPVRINTPDKKNKNRTDDNESCLLYTSRCV